QGADHDGEGGDLEALDRRRADADPDAADPVGDARPLAQEGEDAGKVGGECVGRVEEAEIGAFGEVAELRNARLDEDRPGIACRMGGAECDPAAWSVAVTAHPLPPARAPAEFAARAPIRRST